MQDRAKLLFGCDPRSLAVFRIALGVLVLCDVWVRYGAAASFYSDSGFFGRALAIELSPDAYSLNYLSGAVGFQKLIFVGLGFFAILLGIGFHTRLATVGCWLLLASIHARNPMYLIGGDTLLRMLLFWSLFIPLGRVWSVDCWRVTKDPARIKPESRTTAVVYSVATGCLLIQVCLMYWTAGGSKWNAAWLDGSAMDYILRQECYSRPLSGWLVQFTWLTSLLTRSTLVIELLLPLLLFIPYRIAQLRILTILMFWSFHVGIDLSMVVGKFTYVSLAAWLPFVPSAFWERWPWTQGLVDTERGGAEGESSKSGFRRWSSKVLSVGLPLALLLYVVVWNFAGLYGGPGKTWLDRKPDLFYRFGNATMLRQNFKMFCVPARANTTYLFSGRLRDGRRVDLVRHQPANETGPGAALPQAREWRTLHWYLISFGADRKVYESLLAYHSDVWNRGADRNHQVMESRLERYVEDFGPGIKPGSFVHTRDLAEWTNSTQSEATDEQLKQEFDQLMDQLDNGSLFPFQ